MAAAQDATKPAAEDSRQIASHALVPLALEDAALIAEFEDDERDVQMLLSYPSYQRKHVANALRDGRAEHAAWQVEAQRWRARGWCVLPYEEGGVPLTGEGVLSVRAYVDAQTGEPAAVTEGTPQHALVVALIGENEEDPSGPSVSWRAEYGVIAPAELGWALRETCREQYDNDDGVHR